MSALLCVLAMTATIPTLHGEATGPTPSPTTGDAQHEPRFFTHKDMMTELRDGWEAAGRLVGLDTAQGVASLVSASFSQPPGQADAADKLDSPPQHSLFHGFFRLLGYDTTKLNAIAVNALLFIAKMLGTSLVKNFSADTSGRKFKDMKEPEGTPLSWALEMVKRNWSPLLSRVQDPGMADQLISSLQAAPADTDCVQLLVCRLAPFLAGMQRSLRPLLSPAHPAPDPDLATWAVLSPLQRMLYFLPTRQSLRDSADQCGRRIPTCRQLFAAFD